jgi:hypothetical protein
VAEAFAHLGFPAYFRIELSWVKLAGVAALLLPMVPARGSRSGPTQASPSRSSRRWFAHLAVGDGVEAWSWPVGTGVLWGASYFFFRRLQAGAAAI